MGDGQRPIYADAKPIMAKQRAAALHTQRASLNMLAFLTGIFHPHSYGGDGNKAHSFPAALLRIMPRRGKRWKNRLRRQKMQKILKRCAKPGRRWRKCAGSVECAKRGGLNVCSNRPQRPAGSPRLLGVSDRAALKPASLGHFRQGGAGTRVNRAFAGRQAGNPRKYWAGGQGGRKRPFHADWSGDDGAVRQARRALKRMLQGR